MFVSLQFKLELKKEDKEKLIGPAQGLFSPEASVGGRGVG